MFRKIKVFLPVFIAISLLLQNKISAKQSSVEFTDSNLPIVIIDTGGKDIPPDDPRIIADMHIIFNENGQRNFLDSSESHYSGKISIEIRGESSAGWDIKSYGFETQNQDGSNRNVSLLGLPEDNDWILHAPFYDRSLMRNVLSYHLARGMGWYASRTVYCELVLNGEYQGVYVLMEKIKRGENRVDIARLSPDEISGDDVTGGYILRVDKEPWNAGFDSPFPAEGNSQKKIRYQYFYPKGDEIVPEQETYIEAFISDFEVMMYNGANSDQTLAYEDFLNVDSFVDYVILNELSRNVDGYRLSSYLTKQKDSDGGKLIAGPVWDYNFSFGNAGYYDSYLTEGWQLLFFVNSSFFHQRDGFLIPFWWKVLFKDRVFDEKLIQRWEELRQDILSLETLYQTMDDFADTLAEARVRNFEVRPAPGSTDLGGGWHPDDPRSDQINSYEDELAVTKTWIADRIAWIDSNIHLLVSVDEEENIPNSYLLKQNYPNPFNPSTNISFELPKSAFVNLSIYNIKGQLVLKLVNQTLSQGIHEVEFNGENVSSGIYFYSLKTADFSQTQKMMLIK